MMKCLFELGAVVLNVLIRSKLKDNARDNFIDIVSMLKSFGIDELETRNINRGFEKISDEITSSCKKILDNMEVEESRKLVIINSLITAYKDMNISIADFLQMHADEDEIRKKLLDANTEYHDDLDETERELYERLIEHTSHLLVNAYMKFPEFNAEGIKRLNFKIDEIADKMDELISQMEKVEQLVSKKGSRNSNFERQYRNKIISQNSYIYLFGAGDLASEYKKYQLSIAYVELEMVDESSQRIIKIGKMLEKSKNIWLSGDAGLGKTTLLQWFAVKSAENDSEIPGLRDTIPIFIRLRKYNCQKLSLRECINDVMKDSSYDIPAGWIEQSIDLGRFVFLIDGFDEVSETDRWNVLDWLEQIDKKEKCTKIYTARPQVKERPNSFNLIEANILPMNRSRIRRFVDYWHKAVLDEQLRIDESDAQSIANGLYEKIILNDPIMKLAAVPLLCAMICALHYRNEMNLPTNKRELYEECCKMLIERRDKEKRILYIDVNLNYEQKKIVLAKLAYWMMKNNYVEVLKSSAQKNVGRSIDGMGLPKAFRDRKIIFKYMLERCGILREPEKGKIDFIHRTFQEYLTAFEISREEDWGVIEDKIGNTTWQETIGLSIGYSKKSTATKIIRSTLNKGREKGESKKYLFLAISYLSGAIEVDKDLRQSIEDEVGRLIPPAIEECAQIAEAGDLAVQFLANKRGYNERERLACLRVLNMAGTVKSLEVSKTYFDGPLSIKEINELGKLYSQFPSKELIDHDIHITLEKYLKKVQGSNVVLHSEMVCILNLLRRDYLSQILNEDIDRLEIIQYSNNIPKMKCNIFENIKSLSLSGDFTKSQFLRYFTNIKQLKIYSKGLMFSIYNLNLYQNFYNLEYFSIITEAKEYISGRDLAFLSNCENLEIILLNDMSEIILEDFALLKSLRKITIGADFAMELDFNLLPDYIETLTILVPKEIVPYAKSEAYEYRKFKKVIIKELEVID